MRGARSVLSVLPLMIFVVGCTFNMASRSEAQVPRMTKEQLLPFLGNPDVIIIDVRIGDEYKRHEQKIKGAVREDPEKDVKTWAHRYGKDKTLVFYCS
jgi:hypothetical protein